MKRFLKILTLSMIAVMCLATFSFAAETNASDLISLADAEGEDPFYGYDVRPGSALEVQVVPDPYNVDNKVYYLEASVADRTAWTYIWFYSMNFVPGETYSISYDVLIETDATGAMVAAGGSNACFAFAQTDENPGTIIHHAVTGGSVTYGNWGNISTTYTVPKSLDTSLGMMFGIYANPGNNCGTSFYVDNISVKKLSAGEDDPDTLTIFCIGNSVLQHGVSPSLGWYGNWGMAASAEDKDYFSVMQQLFNADFPNVKNEWHRAAAAGFERGITDSLTEDYYDVIFDSFGAKLKSVVPDIVTIQMGENTNYASVSAESFAHAIEQCIDFCRSVNPDVKIILSTMAIGSENDKRSVGMILAAANKGVEIVNLSQYNTYENSASGFFDHAGVASHPGDKGMQKIAEAFYEVIKAYALGDEVEYELSVVVSGQNEDFSIEPVVEDGVVFVSLKEVATKLGYLVYFDESYKAICLCRGTENIIVPANQQYVMSNDSIIKLSVPTKKNGDDILIPCENIFSINVLYNKALNSITIVA